MTATRYIARYCELAHYSIYTGVQLASTLAQEGAFALRRISLRGKSLVIKNSPALRGGCKLKRSLLSGCGNCCASVSRECWNSLIFNAYSCQGRRRRLHGDTGIRMSGDFQCAEGNFIFAA